MLLGPLISYVLGVWYPDRAEMLTQTSMTLPFPDCQDVGSLGAWLDASTKYSHPSRAGLDHRCLNTMHSLCFPLNGGDYCLTLSTVSAVLFKVYCIDHTYTTIRVPVAASVKEVISAVADKLGSGEGLIIVKMNSGGGNNLDLHCGLFMK